MNLSSTGTHLIASFEGFVPTWYNDGTGVETIGYGHTGPLPAGFTAPLTSSAGLDLLHHDTAGFAAAVTRDVHVELGTIKTHAQARFDALVSLAYNIGTASFASSSLLRAINEKPAPRDWTPLGPLWLEWDHAGGAVLPGLLTRRRSEFVIFRSGKYPAT